MKIYFGLYLMVVTTSRVDLFPDVEAIQAFSKLFPFEAIYIVDREDHDRDREEVNKLTMAEEAHEAQKMVMQTSIKNCLQKHINHKDERDSVILCKVNNQLPAISNISLTIDHNIWIVQEEVFANYQHLFNLRLDSKFFVYSNVSWKEIYAIKKVPMTKTLCFGTVSCIKNVTKFNLFEGRSDLSSVLINVTAMNSKPFNIHEYDENGNIIGATGMFFEVFEKLQDIMNFTYVLMEPPDQKWGADEGNGTWNGLIGQLQRKEVDLSIGVLITTFERSQVADFIHGIFQSYNTLLIYKQEQSRMVNYWAYFIVFTKASWCLFFGYVLIFGVAYYFLNASTLRLSLIKKLENVTGHISLVFIIFLQRSLPIDTRSISIKILYFTTCIAGFMLFSVYSGVLTSMMTAGSQPININTFEDALNQGLDFYVNPNAAQETYFIKSPENSIFAKIYREKIKGKPSPIKTGSSEERVTILGKRPGQIAVFAASSSINYPNEIVALNLRDKVAITSLFCVQKNSEFKGMFDYFVIKLMEAGVLKEIQKKWMKTENAIDPNDFHGKVFPLGYFNLVFPFFVLLFGSVSSCLLVVLEKALNLGKSVVKNETWHGFH